MRTALSARAELVGWRRAEAGLSEVTMGSPTMGWVLGPPQGAWVERAGQIQTWKTVNAINSRSRPSGSLQKCFSFSIVRRRWTKTKSLQE